MGEAVVLKSVWCKLIGIEQGQDYGWSRSFNEDRIYESWLGDDENGNGVEANRYIISKAVLSLDISLPINQMCKLRA